MSVLTSDTGDHVHPHIDWRAGAWAGVMIFPWFVGARSWISLFNHVVFGAVIGKFSASAS